MKKGILKLNVFFDFSHGVDNVELIVGKTNPATQVVDQLNIIHGKEAMDIYNKLTEGMC